MSPRTLANYRSFLVRFGAYQGEHPREPADTLVVGFLATLPISSQFSARAALKWAYPALVEWRDIRVATYRRDEARLYQGILRYDARNRLRAAGGPRERAMIELLWTLRRHEVAALCWSAVDLGPGTVLVRNGKGGKSAPTLIAPEAQQAIARWYIAAGKPPDTAPVFPSRSGGHYNPETIGRIIQRLLTKVGLWSRGMGSAHRLRRSFASAYLKDNKDDLVGLQRLMRHSKVSTTAGYVFLETDDLAARLARVKL